MSGGRRPPPLPAESQTGGQRRQQQAAGAGDSSRLRANDPSSSRPRSADVLWPEHFVEAAAVRVAENAATFDVEGACRPCSCRAFFFSDLFLGRDSELLSLICFNLPFSARFLLVGV
ncbi:hypothetical protein HPP92_028398 [Vanilla planifolia]|uniref:Uncharacterized protein n=1 Tax=Vanilla planifolia TaxID=51239 RepID=A0A835U2N6_VANPL|nr:hypothetical protein HPP92_028398 [Vanilla planifolia]